MALGWRTVTGLSHNQANDGIPIASIPGDPGGPIAAAVVFAYGRGLTPSQPTGTIQLFPGEKFETGVNSLGVIVVSDTWSNLGDDIHFGTSTTTLDLTDGFWGASVRALVAALPGSGGTREFVIQFSTYEPGDFSSDPSFSTVPTSLDDSDASYDPVEEEGSVILSFQYDNALGEDPIGFVINRDGVFVGTVPFGTSPYTYTDYVFAAGDFTYTIQAYKYSPAFISPVSNSIVVSFGGALPDITVIGGNIPWIGYGWYWDGYTWTWEDITAEVWTWTDWISWLDDGEVSDGGVPAVAGVPSNGGSVFNGIFIGGFADIVFIGDPSGIYTLVANKTHDTLYERTDVDFVDVKIPNPFFKTAFLGD